MGVGQVLVDSACPLVAPGFVASDGHALYAHALSRMGRHGSIAGQGNLGSRPVVFPRGHRVGRVPRRVSSNVLQIPSGTLRKGDPSRRLLFPWRHHAGNGTFCQPDRRAPGAIPRGGSRHATGMGNRGDDRSSWSLCPSDSQRPMESRPPGQTSSLLGDALANPIGHIRLPLVGNDRMAGSPSYHSAPSMDRRKGSHGDAVSAMGSRHMGADTQR